jgi:hypothetical protein
LATELATAFEAGTGSEANTVALRNNPHKTTKAAILVFISFNF